MIPRDNEKDLVDIPKNIKDKLNIVPVRWIDEVLQLTLQNMPAPKAVGRPIAGDDASKARRRRRTPGCGHTEKWLEFPGIFASGTGNRG